MVYDLGGSKLTKNVPVIESDRAKFAISDDEILTLAPAHRAYTQQYQQFEKQEC